MSGPAWLGIGAQRSGTSWLARHMRLHPQLWVPPEKEVHYFDDRKRMIQLAGPLQLARMLTGQGRPEKRWRVQASRAWKRHLPRPQRDRLRWDLRYVFGNRGDDWYLSLFDLAPEGRLPGEITPAYAGLRDDTVDAVHSIAPQARIIYLLRNPIDRIWSHLALNNARVRRERGFIPDELGKLLTSGGILARTAYTATMDSWSARFGEDQMFVGFFDDIRHDPERILARIYSHLGVGREVPHEVSVGKVHGRAGETIPTRVAVAIAHQYIDEMDAVADRLGGHASVWQAIGHRLIDDPPPVEQLSHPLDPGELGIDVSGHVVQRPTRSPGP